MPIVGTAGHVDHGKSTLITALTGRDPDRWAEEKERGLTIDLGFAWARVGEHDVSFVDVPGHERFLKNMLAGVDPIDIALFVVAADEGWSAQSEEHLAILDLLGIAPGVIALTKTDRVDADLVELAALEVEDRLAGTSLEGSAVIGVSAVTGDGLPELIEALAGLLSSLPDRRPGPPTLWVDRVFSASGAGTIVTGSLAGGPVAVGDLLELQPGGQRSRVRSIQSHESVLPEVGPGRRVALGVPDIAREVAVRGSVLTPPGIRRPTSVLLADIRPARGHDPGHLRRGAFHLHVGAGDWPAQVRAVEDGTVIIRVAGQVPAISGDRFILRDAGRRAVVGGGQVLDPHPDPRSKVARRAAAAIRLSIPLGREAVADALVEVRGIARVDDLVAWSGGGSPTGGTIAGQVVLHDARLSALEQQARALVDEYHAEFPLREGLPKARLATALGVPLEVVDVVLTASADLLLDASFVTTRAHRPTLRPEQEIAWTEIRSHLTTAGLAPPKGTESIADEELRHLLLRNGDLVAVGEFLYLPASLAGVRTILEALPQPFTVAEAKEALGISRKHAVPLMEWCDATGMTKRAGSDRTIR